MDLGRPHPLDNVVWTALTTTHASIAYGQGLARHYPRDMAPFSAVAEPSERAYGDLAETLDSRVEARLFRPREEPAFSGWETLSARPIIQMIAADRGPAIGATTAAVSIESLAISNEAEMLALAQIAEPGPFSARTILFGGYFGIRDMQTGCLLAMGGERFRFPGYVELSAICVHPAARKQGFGRLLTYHLAEQAFGRGEVPFLRAFPDNPAASLYAKCGFRERARLWVIWRRPIPKLASVSL
jgi:ribosomal protein S18 acetylase RimI-like enzyme